MTSFHVRHIALILFLVPASCDRRDTSGESAILATVGGESLTIADFEAAMVRRGVADEASKSALLDEMLAELRILHAAKSEGLESAPEVRLATRSALVSVHRQRAGLNDDESLEPSEEEVQAYFNRQLDEFRVPPQLRASILRISVPEGSSAETRAVAATRMEQALAEARKEPPGPHFGALAVKYSDDQETRYQGGDLGYVTPEDGRLPPPVFAAAMKLEPGTLSEVVETPGGFYLVKVVEKAPESTQAYRSAAPTIRAKLRAARSREREDAYHRELADIPVDLARDKLQDLPIPGAASSKAPPPLP